MRERVLAIAEAGLPHRRLAGRLSLPYDTFKGLLWGGSGYGPSEKIRRETAELVMAFWPTLQDFPDSARIDPTGTRRRVDAMMVLGWSRRAMADELGLRSAQFNTALAGERVTARLARAVSRLYDEWWDQVPEEHGVAGAYAVRTRRMSAARGAMPPQAWDDATIDDPRAQPALDAEPPTPAETNAATRFLLGESVVLNQGARREVIGYLMEWSDRSPESVGELLEMSPAAVERQWERIKTRAREAGERVPVRRLLPTCV
ncbi:hypothetical protein WKI65_43115 [Streptomyces sp. MS1.AVA.3]|uniref:hypothetical protein n=1 Tax=Streptomyces decoyicus TaxID=249567 RepID=UPI0030BE02A5